MTDYLNMNREEIIARVNQLKAQYAFYGIQLDLSPEIIFDNRQESIWYSGEIASFEYKERYTVTILLNGDVRAYLYDEDNQIFVKVKDTSGNFNFYTYMADYIKSDEEYFQAWEDDRLDVLEKNWFEITIFDNKNKHYVAEGEPIDWMESVLDLDYRSIMEEIGLYL